MKEAIGQAIIDAIIVRTQDGVSQNGKKFGTYSKQYIDSLPFKAFGKSKNDINLTLSGDMLGLLDILDQTKNTMTFGWDDDDQIPKAFNHITGDTVKKRDFFGLTSEDIKTIRDQFDDLIDERSDG